MMAAVCTALEDVREAMNAAAASPSTVTALQTLLGLETGPNPGKTAKLTTIAQKAANTKAANAKPGAKTVPSRTKKSHPVAIPEDAPKPLLPREKYALATETVNSGLRVLNDAVKVLSQRSGPRQDDTPATSNQTSQAALQPRSGNITSCRKSPEKARTKAQAAIKAGAQHDASIAATAECTRMAFAFLRSADTQKLGVREMPRLQLETGMLALVGKLIPLGLEAMATKELRHVKRRLQALCNSTKERKTTIAKPGNKVTQPERETLASLLDLDVEIDDDKAALSLAVTYCMHAVKVISLSGKPATLEDCAQYLAIERHNSLASLLLRQDRDKTQTAKVEKQLDVLSQTILALCPSYSSSNDTVALDPSKSVSPETALKLQTIALQLRKRWWNIAGHQPDVEKELLEPFLRWAMAFTRRSGSDLESQSIYKRLSEAFAVLGPVESPENITAAIFNIRSLLSHQAERAGRPKEAMNWAKEMQDGCSGLNNDHARRLTALVQHQCVSLRTLSKGADSLDLKVVSDGLERKLIGTAADFDSLISSLHEWAATASEHGCLENSDVGLRKTFVLAAGFALRYARSYPGRGARHVAAIIKVALRFSKSSEDLLSWVTADAAKALIQADALKTVADLASRRPLAEAWEASSDVNSLGRICKALILSKVQAQGTLSSGGVLDDEKLLPDQRGALLEMQLEVAIQLSSKKKYHAALRTIVGALLPALDHAYAADLYPVRRARVAVQVLRLQATCPALLPQESTALREETVSPQLDTLAEDAALQPYLDDVNASLTVAKAFHGGNPTFEQIQPALSSWSKLLRTSPDASVFKGRIESPSALARQLLTLGKYFAMRGDDQSRIQVLFLSSRLENLAGPDLQLNDTSAANGLAECYLDLGLAERAGEVLSRQSAALGTELNQLHATLIRAQQYLAMGNLEECARALTASKELREAITPATVDRDQRRVYELLHAQAWLISSRYALESGSPHEALAAAKRSVKVLNSMWASLERSQNSHTSDEDHGVVPTEPDDCEVASLAKGVSKLQLTPKDDPSNAKASKSKNGAAFWPLVPVLTKALAHLSSMYSHHGLFSEANYYSERAISIAESVSSGILLSRIRSHRVHLLVLAGRLEEAELCLTQSEATELLQPSLAMVERLCAMAVVKAKTYLYQEAIDLLEKAQNIVNEMTSETFMAAIERSHIGDDFIDKVEKLSLNEAQPPKSTLKRARQPAKRSTARSKVSQPVPGEMENSTSRQPVGVYQHHCHVLFELRTGILLQSTMIKLKVGRDVEESLSSLISQSNSNSIMIQMRLAQYLQFMAEANTALEMDVTMNVLAESTLSLPSSHKYSKFVDAEAASDSSNPPSKFNKAATKSRKPSAKSKNTPQNTIATLLQAASDCFAGRTSASLQYSGTAHTHLECSMMAKSTMLLSAVGDHGQSELIDTSQQGFRIEQPRMKALHFECEAANADSAGSDSSEPLSWPQGLKVRPSDVATMATFQEKYIDIIPKPWTAVSLCLNDDASELYIARYRSEQQPLILRLPFSRHKPDDVDEEAFDYTRGKAELQEIIELSNYTCHSSRNMDAKGAKTTWWSDREALDRRMHELLVNMENIWFGGFKSIFARDQRDVKLLSHFRKSFEDVMKRYLPSRSAGKGKAQRLELDDKVLELFIGLGHDQDGVVDLDEPLADLLYFVVDMLQFSGERNAYDEIDFDGMAVDVMDALRTYHEALENEVQVNQHLVLVLDRRLQAFPWENMPCLQGGSVSRVGSMQSLYECIKRMRSAKTPKTQKPSEDGENCHVIERVSGSYILNPSGDLKGTQTMLSPALSGLKDRFGHTWTSIVNEPPDEQRFSSTLESSTITLYFGHGAGSQYIRPRAVKRLKHCSEVVWLMGCSSGAVTENGDLEPSAVPHAYLLAGSKGDGDDIAPSNATDRKSSSKCMSVLATLWDVTDKDVDRFSLAVGEEWGLWPSSEQSKLPAKTPKKRAARQIVAPSTPQQVLKTPKTPKVHKTPAATIAKTPARGRGGDKDDGRKKSLVEAVARSREVCYLRYLNGAAPVVYGVPVYLDD